MASYDFFRHFRECDGDDALIGDAASPTLPDTESERYLSRAQKSPGNQRDFAKRVGSERPAYRRSDIQHDELISRHQFNISKTLPFFGCGTRIKTRSGEVPVESLDKADQVLTRDHGFQPVLWVGRTEIPAGYFRENPNACPIVIPENSLGPNYPARPLCVARSQRILLRSQGAELAFLSSEVFAEALVWVQSGKAERVQPESALTVTHVLLESHEVIMADGVWVESMLAAPEMLHLLDPADKAGLENFLGAKIHTQQTARPCVTNKEAMMLLNQEATNEYARNAQPEPKHS